MADAPETRLDLSDFPGLMLYVDEGDQPPGSAVEQTNMASVMWGQIQTRRGYAIVQFED